MGTPRTLLLTMPWPAEERPAQCAANVNPFLWAAQTSLASSLCAGSASKRSGRASETVVPEQQSSERIPRRARGIFQVADIGAQPQAETGADRHQHDIVRGQCGHAEAT